MRQAGQEDVKVGEDQAAQVEHRLDMQPPQVSGRKVSNRKGEERHAAKSGADTQSQNIRRDK